MKKRFLPILATALFATAALVGCNKKDPEPTPGPTQDYTIAITNKATLQAEWHVKETARKVEFTIAPEIAVEEAYKSGALTITSSNTSIVSVTKYMVSPVAAGEATITASYKYTYGSSTKTVSDTVKLTVGEEQGEPAIKEVTLKELLEDAAQHTQKYRVTGEIVSVATGKTGMTEYGDYMLKDSSVTESVLVYGSTATETALTWDNETKKYSFKNPKDFLTNEVTKDIKVGDTVTLEVEYLLYGTTVELQGIVKNVQPAAGVLPTKITMSGLPEQLEVGYYYKANLAFEPAECNEKKVVWSCAQEGAVIFDDAGGVQAVAPVASAEIVATSEKAPTVSGSQTVEVIANKNPECAIQTPAAGEFKAGFVQATNHGNFFIKDSIDEKGYLNTTKKGKTEAAIVTIEAGEEETLFVKVGDKYIGWDADAYGKIKLVDSADKAQPFEAHPTLKILVTADPTLTEGDPVFYTIATYKTYDTIGFRKLEYVVKDNQLLAGACPLHLYEKTAPKDPATPEPAVVTDKTMAEVLALSDEEGKAKLYELSVKVKVLGKKSDGSVAVDKYGNFWVTDADGNNLTQVYGSTATASAMTWDGEKAYSFKNPQDYLTNELTKNIAVGDTVKLHVIKSSYNSVAQFGGAVVISVTPGPKEDLQSIEVSGETTVAVEGETTLTAAPNPTSAVLGDLTWSVTAGSDKVSLSATTGTSIKVTGVAEGSATINVTNGTKSKDVAITVSGTVKKADVTFEVVDDTIEGYTYIGKESQKIEKSGVTILNEKGKATSDCVDVTGKKYFQAYAHSNLTITASSNIAKMVFTSSYSDKILKGTFDGVSLATDGKVVTATVTSPSKTVSLTDLDAQGRFIKIEIFYAA